VNDGRSGKGDDGNDYNHDIGREHVSSFSPLLMVDGKVCQYPNQELFLFFVAATSGHWHVTSE